VSNGLTNEDGKARERKTARDIVDYIYLTEVQPRFQRLQRQVHLEGYGFAFRGIHFVKGAHTGLEDLRGVLDKFDAGENATVSCADFTAGCNFGSFCDAAAAVCSGLFPFSGIIDVVLQI
jgi:hypothetical protein